MCDPTLAVHLTPAVHPKRQLHTPRHLHTASQLHTPYQHVRPTARAQTTAAIWLPCLYSCAQVGMHRPSWSILPSDIEMEQWALGVGSFGAVFRAKWQGSQVWT